MLPKYDLVTASRLQDLAEMGVHPDYAAFLQELKTALKNQTACYLSIDLETSGKSEGCGVFSVGLVPMLEDGTILQDLGFYAKMNYTEVLKNHPSHPGTMRWHMEQKDEVRKEMLRYTGFGTGAEHHCLRAALHYIEAIRSMLSGNAEIYAIGNDPSFDCSILKRAWVDAGLIRTDPKGEEDYPWKFWDECSLRQMIRDASLVTGANLKTAVPRQGTHHNAFDDAIHQAAIYGTGLRWLLGARTRLREMDARPAGKEA